jgi:DNA polymerase
MNLDDSLMPIPATDHRENKLQELPIAKTHSNSIKTIDKIPKASIAKPIIQTIPLNKTKEVQNDICDPLVEKTRKLADKIERLQDLYEAIRNFDECPLKYTAKNTVICDGIHSSDVMMIGEAPGAQEDEQGIPFCGDSGKLLDSILRSIGLSRQQNVYITNTIFWRPPANRKPTDLEVAICRPFVEKHISLIQPKLLILVGSTALTALCGQERQISKDRNQYYEYTNRYLKQPISATAIFHPAYLLRQPMKKKDMWCDMLTIKKILQGNLLIGK